MVTLVLAKVAVVTFDHSSPDRLLNL